MEQLEEIFDNCDEVHSGKVSVSALITATRNEVFNSDKETDISASHSLLQSVRDLLDPLQQNTLIDKATWTKAWQRLGDGELNMDASCDGLLDQSKQSYCFSPGSRSSSLDSENEDFTVLKQENEGLKSHLKILKEQLQAQEDLLIQEQTEKRELEKNLALSKNQITKLTKEVKLLQESNEDLQSTAEFSTRRNDNIVEQSNLIEKQLRAQLAARNNEVALLNKEVEELNQTISILKCEINDLKHDLSEEVKCHSDQIKEFQKAMQSEREEIHSNIIHSLLQKRDLSFRLEESDSSGIDLQSELLELTDVTSLSTLNVDLKSGTGLLSNVKDVVSSTPRVFPVRPAVVSSLLEEMQALGSGIPSSSILDCSFDVQGSFHQSASESDDNCSSRSSTVDEKELTSNNCVPLLSSVNLTNDTKSVDVSPILLNRNLFHQSDQSPEKNCDVVDTIKCTETCNAGMQTIFYEKIEIETQTHTAVSDMGVQTTLLQCDTETQTPSSIFCDLATQTSVLTCNMMTQTCVLALSNSETQTPSVTTCDVETLTTYDLEEVNQSTNTLVCEVGTQTLKETDIQNENDVLKSLEKRISELSLTDIHSSNHGMNVNCSKVACGKDIFKETVVSKDYNSLLTHSTYEVTNKGNHTVDKIPYMHQSKHRHSLVKSSVSPTTRTRKERPSSLCKPPVLQKPNILSNSLRDSAIKETSQKGSASDLVHSTVIEKYQLTQSETKFLPNRFRFWIVVVGLSFLYVMLLLCSTVVLTAGILETLSESGFVSGSSPRWTPQLSYLVKPFLKIKYLKEPVV